MRANYNYKLREFAGRNVLVIEDENIGGMSVTNCIEEVVTDICTAEKIDPNSYMIVYKDSNDNWDGWNHRKKQFLHLGGETWPHAVETYINRQLVSSI